MRGGLLGAAEGAHGGRGGVGGSGGRGLGLGGHGGLNGGVWLCGGGRGASVSTGIALVALTAQ